MASAVVVVAAGPPTTFSPLILAAVLAEVEIATYLIVEQLNIYYAFIVGRKMKKRTTAASRSDIEGQLLKNMMEIFLELIKAGKKSPKGNLQKYYSERDCSLSNGPGVSLYLLHEDTGHP